MMINEARRFYYLATFTRLGAVVEYGWMLAAHDTELVNYARTMGYSIDYALLGQADLTTLMPRVLPATATAAFHALENAS